MHSLKGTYYAKITFIRCLNTVVWKQPVYNCKKKKKKKYNTTKHEQSLQASCFRFSLCSRHRGEKVPPICGDLCSISINTALSEKLQSTINGDIQCQCQSGITSIVFWDALMNIGISIDSLHPTDPLRTL